MAEWIKTDPTVLNKPFSENVRGVQINVLLSPHDVPTGVRGYYDENISRFVIEFRYLDEERSTKEPHDDNITLRIGQSSRRLLGIEVNVDLLRAQSVALNMLVPEIISNALDRLVKEKVDKRREGSYMMAKDVVQQRQGQLFSGLTAK